MFRVRKVLFLLLPAFLLIPVLLLVFASPALSAPAPASSQQGGLGGAYGATSYSLPASATATPVPTVTPTATPVVVPPKMYGGSGKDGACLGTSGAGNDMIKMDFGWSASVLNKQWKDYATYRLCNDHYTWETVTALPIQKVFQTLQWPSDLLPSSYANQIVTLEPLSSFDPVTQQAQQQAQQQGNGQSTETNKNCIWHINLPIGSTDIDICQPIRLIIHAASQGVRWFYQTTEAQISFMWKTPLQPFQDDKTSGLLTIWSTSWAIVLVCITAVIAYGALRYMLGSAVNWLAYANLAELIPRLLFGLLAAYFSKEFFIMLIQGNNALAGVFSQNSLDTVINGKASSVVVESLQILYGLLGFCLMIEEVARMAILYLLFAFAPILFFFASLRETQRWAKTAAVAAVVFGFMQAAQMATLDVGGLVLTTVLKNTGGNLTFLNILVSLAILYLTLLLFFTLSRMALGVGGGMFGPAGRGIYRFGRWGIPAVAGAVGGAAAAYRQARRNLFPLPPRNPPASGTTNGAGGSAGSGNGGQTSVTIGAKPFVSHGNGQGPGGPAGTQNGGPGGKKPGGPAGPGGKKPGGVGPAGAQTASPAAARSPLATSGKTTGAAPSGAAAPGVSRPSSVQHSGPAPSSGAGQWQKTPPSQTQRRRMTEQEFRDWMNEQDEH
jgi:hypothetical protein